MEKEKIIYLLIQTALLHSDGSAIPDLSETEWNEIYEELMAHAIAGIPSECVFENTALPPTVKEKWENRRMRQAVFYYQLLYAQNELYRLMGSNQIPVAILKGTAAAMYYPDPSARAMGDIDFLVPADKFQKAYKLMLENGYRLMCEEDHVDYHMTLEKDGFTYEIHKRPSGLPEGPEGDYLWQVIEDGLNSIEIVSMDEYDIPVFPGMQNGLVLLLHIVKHLKNGLGLRQIIDWMMYVKKELHDDNWYGKMQPILAKTQFEPLAKAVTRMCQLYLGLSETEITWCLDANEIVCKGLMDFIMQQGNFGRKVTMEDKGVKIMGEVHNPLQFFSLLQKRGVENWSLLKKHPYLTPFAWLYMSCRYVKKSLQRKSPMKALMSDMKDGNDRRKLLEQLGIYQK